MKLTLFWLGLTTIVASVVATNGDGDDELNMFVNTYNALHREPPPSRTQSEAEVGEKWITQKLDNFNSSDKRTWKMRYLENPEFYRPGGPLFIIVGGEWTIQTYHLIDGHFYDMAKENNGYLINTEHRFYGKSHPFSDLSAENLSYLTMRQALADLAHFIRTMKSTIKGMTNSKVILHGCSYAATMATLFNREYPDLATGTWATSGPLLAKVNFLEYKEVMGQSIRQVGGQACHDRIHNGITKLEKMFANRQGAEVKTLLNLCSDFNENSELDLWNLFYEISERFARNVQSHRNGTIQFMCDQLLEDKSDFLGLASFLNSEWNNYASCNDFSYDSMVRNLRNISLHHRSYRAWYYQTCNEVGGFQTSDSKNQPFGSSYPLTYFLEWCRDVYGDKFNSEYVHARVAAFNRYFGGLQPNVKNVYTTQGQLDPWRPLGLQTGELTTIIPNHAHCSDMGSISKDDAVELRQSKERIAKLVREWVAKD